MARKRDGGFSPGMGQLPGSVGKHIHGYLPTEAGFLITQQHSRAGDGLGAWAGPGVLALRVAALPAVAAVLLQRRDA